MNEPEPVYLGAFQPMKRGDILDRYIDISADLVSARGETIETATFTVTAAGSEDPIMAVAEGSVRITGGRVDFQLTAPEIPGTYRMIVVFTISDGQRITKTATFDVV